MIQLSSLDKVRVILAFYAMISVQPSFATQLTASAQQLNGGSDGLQSSISETNAQRDDTQTVQLLDGGAIRVSHTAFYFREVFVGSAVTKTVTTVRNNSSETVRLRPSISGDDSFTITGGGCGLSLAPGDHCEIAVQFLPTAPAPSAELATLKLGIPTLGRGVTQSVELKGQSVSLAPGDVTQTTNPQVAQYTMTLPKGARWSVAFGPTMSYGLSTSAQTMSAQGTSSMYVAGMLPNTTYHMQASIKLIGGATTVDVDHTFTTGALPAGIPAKFQTSTTAGMTPQPGIELVNTVIGVVGSTALATDLQGNVIWTYTYSASGSAFLYPVRQLPNGHFLCMIAPITLGVPPSSTTNVIREFDLAGNTVQQLSMDELNTRLVAKGFHMTLSAFSHDLLLLPNGHYLVIANLFKSFASLAGYPAGQSVLGDAVVDLDRNFQPQWVWNSFDHLDIDRRPMGFPDWTHANSLAYSTDDGNFLISIRHQNWVLKIDYRNGKGTGNIIWHLGEGGDFALQNGVDPTDWFYAQHDANFSAVRTTGVFRMTLFDNGDDRQFPAGFICGPLPGQTPCYYSTVQELKINEHTMTATLLFNPMLPPNLYSSFAGNNEVLPNRNFEYNAAGTSTGAYVLEVTPGATPTAAPQTVWEMALPQINTYRAFRQPSLYPGVQW